VKGLFTFFPKAFHFPLLPPLPPPSAPTRLTPSVSLQGRARASCECRISQHPPTQNPLLFEKCLGHFWVSRTENAPHLVVTLVAFLMLCENNTHTHFTAPLVILRGYDQHYCKTTEPRAKSPVAQLFQKFNLLFFLSTFC